jgi:tetratricopeptide (TPR) repeat protein
MAVVGWRWRMAAAALSVAVVQPADAEWLEATSSHFIVYADSNAVDIKRQAEQLERFDGVLRYFHHIPSQPEDEANKVTVYVVADEEAVRRLCGGGIGCRNVAGFYEPRVSGSVAFTPKGGFDTSNVLDLQPRIVLFHEYAHHFLLGNYAAAYPAWFSEGYAEFASTALVTKDYVQIGGAANHRAYSLRNDRGLSVEQLFTTRTKPLSPQDTESLYARGWLLTHHIMFDEGRRKQFATYLAALNAGTPSLDAARAAFGDLKAMNRNLDRYLAQTTIPGARIPIERLPAVSVSVRALAPGEKAMIGLRMQSDRGVNRTSAQSVFTRAVGIAAAYPHDPVVQGWLAEMAYDAGRDDLADAAADRALAADPKSEQALVYKAEIALHRARDAKIKDAAVWQAARSWIIKANHLDPNDAQALLLFYTSFALADQPPTASAIKALYRALELVPQDPGLRFAVARQAIIDGKIDDARHTLQPLAFDAHAGPNNPAAQLVALLDAGLKGKAALAAVDGSGGEKAGQTAAPNTAAGSTP